MAGDQAPESSIILYQTEDGRTRIDCRFQDQNLWLTQAQIAELFQTSVPNINLHLTAIYKEGELRESATIKSYLIVRKEGERTVSREVLHYSLPAILAVGYRVRSARGMQFRQWATLRLSEYLVKGFTMDDERLKNPPGMGVPDYFDELLERIRDIRASERRVYSIWKKAGVAWVYSGSIRPLTGLSSECCCPMRLMLSTHKAWLRRKGSIAVKII